jgi:hypothetical protein
MGLGGGVPVAAASGGPLGLNAAIHLRRYTQITQRQPTRGLWTVTAKLDQLERLGMRVFITNVKGTFLGMSESEEASKRR